MKENKNGFTLVELLIGFAILAVTMVIAIGAIKPEMLIGRANDSRRKSDLNKIKRAFEEYVTDKGYYPLNANLYEWNKSDNCGKTISDMEKYINKWPCDPNGGIYQMLSGDDWFKVVTNLDNKNDTDIPSGWYTSGTYSTSGFDKEKVNYGVSSSNILWYEQKLQCDMTTCYTGPDCNAPQNGVCNSQNDGGLGCYRRNLLNNSCKECFEPDGCSL